MCSQVNALHRDGGGIQHGLPQRPQGSGKGEDGPVVVRIGVPVQQRSARSADCGLDAPQDFGVTSLREVRHAFRDSSTSSAWSHCRFRRPVLPSTLESGGKRDARLSSQTSGGGDGPWPARFDVPDLRVGSHRIFDGNRSADLLHSRGFCGGRVRRVLPGRICRHRIHARSEAARGTTCPSHATKWACCSPA